MSMMMEDTINIEAVFRPGSGIILEYLDEMGYLKSYGTRIDDIDERHILINMPSERQVPIRIAEGTEITIRRQDDQKKQAYLSHVIVVENRPEKIPVLACNRPEKVEVTPRRRFFRCEVSLPFRYNGENL